MKMEHRCCHCSGRAPERWCVCRCHRQEDCEYWETLAFIWICDAIDEPRRRDAWRRFCDAFPQYGRETHVEFWERMLQTEWYRRHGYKHHHGHHHGEYC